jgi:phage tail-like protein
MMEGQFEFRLVVKGLQASQTFQVLPGTTTIGRQAGNDLQLDHVQISRRHARLDCTLTGCQITDLGSSNGTYVDGEKLPPHTPLPLSHSAEIRIGALEMLFEQIAVPAAPLAEHGPAREAVAPPQAETEEVEMGTPALHRDGTDSRAAYPSSAGGTVWGGPPSLAAPPTVPDPSSGGEPSLPPRLSLESQRLLGFLPGIYHTPYMARLLGLVEAILTPIEWNVDNFDLYLNPGTSPAAFLPWLVNWFEIASDPIWREAQRRRLLAEAHEIYARRGTRWAVARVMEIYIGCKPEIIDLAEGQVPFTFTVRVPLRAQEVDRELVERLIDANKPAHTSYTLEFVGS